MVLQGDGSSTEKAYFFCLLKSVQALLPPMASLFLNYESINTCSSVLIAVQAGTLDFVSDPHSWSAKTTSVALLFSKQYSLGTPSRLRRRGQCSWPQLGARIIGSSVLISLLGFSLDFGRVAPQQARQDEKS